MSTPISYTPSFIDAKVATVYFNRLWSELSWIRHDKVPRREYYVNRYPVPYTYGSPLHARTYEPQIEHEVIKSISQEVSKYTSETNNNIFIPDVCFLNGYEDGKDQLGWHSDDSPEMDDRKAIAIVTLGEEREIWFRKIPTSESTTSDVTKLQLGNGSICLMSPGMQDTHQHRIPKSSNNICGPRISLTFRGYVGLVKQ